jgi:outer membrane protein TolC
MKSIVWTAALLLIWCPRVVAQATLTAQGGLRLVDAVEATISRHPGLAIQRQEVEIGDALQRQASGVFDQLFETSLNHGRLYGPFGGLTGFRLSPNDSSQVAASYSKLLRSGVSVGGSVDLLRQVDGGVLPGGLSTSSTRLNVVVPLMRGRGSDVTTAGVRAAGLQRDSSVLELRHLTAALMTRVVTSYWGLVAAERLRAVAAASSARGALLVENMRALIAADLSPRGDLASVLANAADREAARFVSEQASVEARQQLWLDMGNRGEDRVEISVGDDFSLLGDLPDVGAFPTDIESFVAAALEGRADYSAATMRVEAARILSAAASNELRPQVDLSVDLGYTALAEGRGFGRYWSALGAGVEGPDVIGRIGYRFPLENRSASGRFAQATAQVQQATLRRDDLARTIRASVVASYSALRTSLSSLARARESVEAFEEALRGEQDKLAMGIGSVISLLTIEDRLTAAAEREAAAWRSYGQALVEFRFATGSLVPVRDPLPALDVRTFTTLPFPLPGARQ